MRKTIHTGQAIGPQLLLLLHQFPQSFWVRPNYLLRRGEGVGRAPRPGGAALGPVKRACAPGAPAPRTWAKPHARPFRHPFGVLKKVQGRILERAESAALCPNMVSLSHLLIGLEVAVVGVPGVPSSSASPCAKSQLSPLRHPFGVPKKAHNFLFGRMPLSVLRMTGRAVGGPRSSASPWAKLQSAPSLHPPRQGQTKLQYSHKRTLSE